MFELRNARPYRSVLFATAVVVGVAVPSVAIAQEPYHVITQWKVGGEGGWDYLAADAAAHRLYITHGARVEVLDSDNGKTIGAITGLQGTHGVALDAAGKYGYISDGRANAVVVFDRSTLKTVTSIPAGMNPDGIVYEPVTKTVWAFNGRSGNVTVIDAKTQKAIATIALPGKPEFPVADGKGNIYDNIEDKNEIVRFDAAAKKLTAEWPACDSPSGLAIDRARRHLFSVCDGKKMAVVDTDTGKVLATPEIGEGPDAAAFDAKDKLAFSSNGEGTLTVVDASKSSFPVLQNLTTQRGARTMAFDSANGRIYLTTAQFGPRPEPTAQTPHPRPSILPATFTVLVVGR
ncbi:MAG TPA: YncE family protein [Acidobacteriaceae bacterium]|nr:YncE family protein [Acidobacteriaceae bacterium]